MSSAPVNVSKMLNTGSYSLRNISIYVLLFIALGLLIYNVVTLSQNAGSADSWNEIKKQMAAIVSTAAICGIFLTIALFLIVTQYPELQVTLFAVLSGISITLSYVAVCIATISR